MARLTIILFFACFGNISQAQWVASAYPNTPWGANQYLGVARYIHPDHNYGVDKDPILIWLHGNGGTSNYNSGSTSAAITAAQNLYAGSEAGIPKMIYDGTDISSRKANIGTNPLEHFVVIAPANDLDHNDFISEIGPQYVDFVLQYLADSLADEVDFTRIYIVGYSGGTNGTWKFPTSRQTAADSLSAFVSIAAVCQGALNYCYIADGNVAAAAFHGSNDGTTSTGCSSGQINAVNACSPSITALYKQTTDNHSSILNVVILPSNRHSDIFGTSMNIYEWMLQYPDNTPPETKIGDIRFSDIIDFQGGSGNPWTFFNQQSSADPENGSSPAASQVTLPSDSKYFPVYQGSQWRFAVDLRAQYHLKKLWYYVANGNGFYDDTLFIFKTSDFLTLQKVDSIRIPSPKTTGWYSYILDDTTRYLVFGLKRKMDGNPNGSRSPEVTEIIPYGNLLAGETREDPLPDTCQATNRIKQTIGNLVGVDIIGGYEQMKYFKDLGIAHVRIMTERFYYDDSTNTNGLIDKKFNADHWNEYNGSSPWRYHYALVDSLVYTTGYVTHELNGASIKVNNQYGSTLGWPVDDFGDHPLSLESYKESGYLLWNLAAQFGSVEVDSNKLRLFRAPRYTGTGLLDHITNGSEINRFWGVSDSSSSGWRYMTALQYVIQSQMDFDGYMDNYGDSIGVNNADPSMKLGMAADYKADSGLLNSRYKLNKAMRSDGVNIWSNFQFNQYPTKQYSGIQHGRHALDYDIESNIKPLVDYSCRLDSNMKVYWTENGFDANPVTDHSTHPRTGTTWTDREWQAINLGWNISQVIKTYVHRYYIYVMVTNQSESHGGTFQTSDLMSSFPSVNLKPPYYYVGNMIRTLKNFRHDSTISKAWRGLNIERLSHDSDPDSLAFLVGYADTTGINYTDVAINLAGIAPGSTVKVVDLSFTSFTNTEENVATSGTTLTHDAGEKLFVVLAISQQSSTPSRNYYRLNKGRIRYRPNN